MKALSLLILLAPFAAAISPQDSVTIISPHPDLRYPLNETFTFGVAEPSKLYYGVISNFLISYQAPGGNKTLALGVGAPITDKGNFSLEDGGFKTNGPFGASVCRTYPGTSSTTSISANLTGNYTFFWDVIYVESSDPSQANSSYCGPPPFSTQSWSLPNVTVTVTDQRLQGFASALPQTTTQSLPSKPTGQVVSGASRIKGGVIAWSHVAGIAAVLFLAIQA